MKYVVLLLMIAVAACAQSAPADNMPMGDMPMGSMHNMPENMPMMHSVESEEEFIVEMIPHHQEAVDTSLVVLESTQNDDLRALAQDIVAAQENEISMMNGWLNNWYDGGYEASYENMMPDLESLEGAERDVAYIEGMIMHHMMAVMMAEQVIELDPRAEVADFAQDGIEVQSREIAQMQEMLSQY